MTSPRRTTTGSVIERLDRPALRPGFLALWTLLALLCCTLMVRTTRAAGMQYTLTMADNGTTLTVHVGDRIVLQLGSSSFYRWDLQLSNPGILHRPPLALVQGTQGVWDVIDTGQTTIGATGTPTCYPQCLAPSLVFTATIVAQPALSAAPGARIPYGAGWYIVGVSQDTTLPVPVYAWDPVVGNYRAIDAGTPLKAGAGYWAFFATPTTLTLLQTTSASAQVQAPAGAWVLAGNPSDHAVATVSGADVLYGWDATNQKYRAITTLQPGEGAWAFSNGGGTITISAGP